MDLDLDFVRTQFPAFQSSQLEGQAFFQSAGGSYACKQVINRLTRFYEERKVQPYDPYNASTLGGEEMDEARKGLADFMRVKVEEVSFGPSTTQNTYVLSQAFRQWLKPGDAIILLTKIMRQTRVLGVDWPRAVLRSVNGVLTLKLGL